VIDIRSISANLILGREGYWLSSQQSQYSYPELGNEIFREFEEKSIWFQHRNECILELMKAYPPAGTIFDIGGGNGFVSRSLLNAGLDVVLVEPGRTGVKNAIERGVPLVICSTLEDAGFKEHVLPSAGLFDTLEHIKDDVAFLKTIRKLLVPNGRLYLTTPAHQILWSADDVFAGHYRRYSRASLSETLMEAGFSVLFSTYIFSFLPVPIFLIRTMASRLGLRSSDKIDKVDQERHHVSPGKLGKSVLGPILAWERGKLKRRSKISIGTSCLVAAQVMPAESHS
jgi:2-polyprenyl-3-methyl-5-hydroxy-6-metoxy-1,4-benzoquinol methylase